MKEKELLTQLDQMRNIMREKIKLLDMPLSYGRNLEALENAIQIVKEHRKSTTKIRQLQRSLKAKQNRSVRSWNSYAS